MSSSWKGYSEKELYDRSPQITYRGRNLDEIAFPLGGIGTGMVSLGGWGQLRNWEIRNHPHKGYNVPHSFFTLNCRSADGSTVTRVLQGPVGGSHAGSHSLARDTGEGLPHFREASFTGHFPIATVELSDPAIPVRVTLEAFNPFIPLNAKDSSIPAAVLTYRLENTSEEDLELFICGNLTNVVGGEDGRTYEEKGSGRLKGLFLTNPTLETDDPAFGSLSLSTPAKGAAIWPRWAIKQRSVQFVKFWEAVSSGRKFPPKVESPEGETGTVGVSIHLDGGAAAVVPFILGWHFPNFEHWKKEPEAAGGCGEGDCCSVARGKTWKNYYATVWGDAWEASAYVSDNLERLERETRLFRDTLFSSTLPSYVLDAVSSQISILKTPTCLRLTDGTFYGFEG